MLFYSFAHRSRRPLHSCQLVVTRTGHFSAENDPRSHESIPVARTGPRNHRKILEDDSGV